MSQMTYKSYNTRGNTKPDDEKQGNLDKFLKKSKQWWLNELMNQ